MHIHEYSLMHTQICTHYVLVSIYSHSCTYHVVEYQLLILQYLFRLLLHFIGHMVMRQEGTHKRSIHWDPLTQLLHAP